MLWRVLNAVHHGNHMHQVLHDLYGTCAAKRQKRAEHYQAAIVSALFCWFSGSESKRFPWA